MRTPFKRLFDTLTVALIATLVLLGLATPATAHHVLPPGIPSNSAAQAQLNSLTVAPEGSTSGYDRSLFPHWNIVESPCDAREYVLRRDGHSVQTDAQCRAVSGSWFSEYDGVTATNASSFDIDHLVALAEAWRSGASSWSTAQRTTFANDVNSAQLWAVTASSNRAKGDSDPANWMPPRTAIHCAYVKAWINIKYRYNLSIDPAERSALQNVLNTRC